MQVRPADGGMEMLDGARVVATARAAEVHLDVPAAPSFADAEAAARSYVGLRYHPYPTCFVCGPQRSEGDGLRIFPGRAAGARLVASPWIPDASLGAGGKVR